MTISRPKFDRIALVNVQMPEGKATSATLSYQDWLHVLNYIQLLERSLRLRAVDPALIDQTRADYVRNFLASDIVKLQLQNILIGYDIAKCRLREQEELALTFTSESDELIVKALIADDPALSYEEAMALCEEASREAQLPGVFFNS